MARYLAVQAPGQVQCQVYPCSTEAGMPGGELSINARLSFCVGCIGNNLGEMEIFTEEWAVEVDRKEAS